MNQLNLISENDSARGESVSDTSSNFSEAGAYTGTPAYANYCTIVNTCPVMLPMVNQQQPSNYVTYDSGLQAKNLDYRREIMELRAKLATAENKILYLEQQIVEITSLEEVVTTDEGHEDLNKKLAYAIGYHYLNDIVAEDLPTGDACLLARIDSLLRHKDNRHFPANCRRLIEGYYPNSRCDAQAMTKTLMHYLHNHDYNQFLTSYYTQLYEKWNKATAVKFMVHLHAYDHNVPLDIRKVINITREKYNYNDTSVVNTLKMDAGQEVFGNDYIYGRHELSDYPLAALHEYSHIDAELTGRDLAKYHVGTACRMNECSVVEVIYEGRSYMFKPFKCYDSYAIMPLLPGERDNRVEAILHHNGQVYVTLVRTFDVEYSEYLIEGNISPQISDLALNYRVNKFEIFFSNDGLCIEIGCMPERGRRVDCCKNAFQRNGVHQRKHKQPEIRQQGFSRVTNILRQKGDKNLNSRVQRRMH